MKEKALRVVIKIDSATPDLAAYMANVPPHDRAKRLISLASASLSQQRVESTPASDTAPTVNRAAAKKKGG